MKGNFLRQYFQFIYKMLPILEQNLNQDKEARVRKIMLDMEIQYILFKKKVIKAFKTPRVGSGSVNDQYEFNK